MNEAPALVDHVDVPSKSDTLPPRVHPGLDEYTTRASRSSYTVTLISTCKLVAKGREGAGDKDRGGKDLPRKQDVINLTPLPSSHN